MIEPNPPAEGMTLRDWFAGRALTGIIAGYALTVSERVPGAQETAKLAYACADAMLTERNRQPQPDANPCPF